MKKFFKKSIPYFLFVLILFLWNYVTENKIVPHYILPTLKSVVDVFKNDYNILIFHLVVTVKEALMGLFFGILIGYTIAVLMQRFDTLRRILYPFVVFTQTVPTVALAPLFVLWFGYDTFPKVVLVAITTFYPIAVGVYEGFKSIDKDYFYLMDSMRATEFQKFRYLKMPMVAPSFFSSLKISVSYSLIGAVIAEWLGGYNGLGVYMVRVKNSYEYDKMFAVIIVISIVSLIAMGLVNLLRKFIIKGDFYEKY